MSSLYSPLKYISSKLEEEKSERVLTKKIKRVVEKELDEQNETLDKIITELISRIEHLENPGFGL